MADAVVAPADLWVAHYSEAALLMPCSYHLNGHSVHQGRAPQRVSSLLVEGGIDGKGYRCSVPPLPVILLRSLPHLACCSFPKGQVVVCAFHRPVKVDPASLSLWARIVLSHPSAILWIISYESYALQNLVRELDSRSLAGRCCSHCK